MKEIWSFILQGGIVMFPLILCSILALAIVFEKLITLKKSKIIREDVLDILSHIQNREDVKMAVSFCENKEGAFSNLVKLSLSSIHLPVAEIRELVSDQGRQEIRILERGLNLLGTVASITPILGLLGTVLGMIKVFQVISIEGVGDPSSLSGGISEALITTAAGLTIAIPTLVFYNYLSHKAESLVLDMEKHINMLFSKLRKINGRKDKA